MFRWFAVPLSALLVLGAPAAGQSLDPQVLEQLQRQLQGQGQLPGGLPDTARDRQPARQGPLAEPPGARVDTVEEQLLRRALARRQLERAYVPTAVEADYRERLAAPGLRLFGYDFFQSAPAPTGGRVGAVGDDYVLGIGDELQVSFRGATNDTRTIRVERDGRVAVGVLRPLQAAGRTLGAVRAALAAETRATLIATEVFVSVGEVRAISVFVGGEVERPGQYSLTSLADIGTAVAQAGGVRRTGSLRRVRLVRAGGATRTVDLYGLVGIGAAPRVALADGDRIILPVLGPTVAVSGGVVRPAIYELAGGETVAQVIAFAGGAIRQRGSDIVLSRIAADGQEVFDRAVSPSARVQGGDAILLLGASAGGAAGRVTLAGNVANPGPRPLAAARTVAELLRSADDLPPETYRLAAILVRRDPATGARRFEGVNLARELSGQSVTPLQGEDRLFLFSRSDIDFVNSTDVRRVVLGQRNPVAGCRSLDRLEALVRDSQSTRFNAVTRTGLVIRSERGAELGATGALVAQGGGRDALQLSGRVDRVQELTVEQLRAERARRERQDPLAPLDREAVPLTADEIESELERRCPAVFEEEPDLLSVLLERAVSVSGGVRRPGAYPVAGPVTAAELEAVAEGLLPNARQLRLDMLRAGDGRAAELAVAPEEQTTVLAATFLAPGDDLRFNVELPVGAASAILVSGQVARPGLYTLQPGERLSDVLRRAGGMTEQGYPYGTVFTRVSVREAQQEGLRRTSRELANSVLAITARSTDRGVEGLGGALGLIQALGSAEVPGRMVVEADPRVLTLRPDLDTVLEPGDTIFVPTRPNYVLALGDVNNPGALQFVEGKALAEYLAEAGGPLSTADRRRAFLVLPDGTAQPVSAGGRAWGSRAAAIAPPPGSTLVVPKNLDPLFRLQVIRDVATIVAQLATSVATVAVLATR